MQKYLKIRDYAARCKRKHLPKPPTKIYNKKKKKTI